MPQVKFVQPANWQGRHLRRGDVVEMAPATAAAYCGNGQAELLPARASAALSDPSESAEAVQRGGNAAKRAKSSRATKPTDDDEDE